MFSTCAPASVGMAVRPAVLSVVCARACEREDTRAGRGGAGRGGAGRGGAGGLSTADTDALVVAAEYGERIPWPSAYATLGA